jgi:hypothetical protein
MAMWYKEDRKGPEILVPLKHVQVEAYFETGVIKIDSELTFVNNGNS